MAAYLLLVVADLRHHQSRGRYPLHRRRSAPALDPPPSGLSEIADVRRRRPPPSRAERAAARAGAAGSRARSTATSCYSFRRSKMTMVAAAVDAAVLPAGALRAACSRRRTRSIRRSSQLMNSRISPLWTAGRPEPVPARHRRPGPRRVFRHSLRLADFARSSACSASSFSGALGITLGLIAGYVGGAVDGADHAHRRRAAHLPRDPDRAAGQRRRQVGVRQPRSTPRARSACWSSRSGCRFWVQYARTVRGSVHGREEQGLCRGRAPDRPAGARRSCCATCCRTSIGPGPGDRHHQSRARRHHRGDAVVPRRRHAADTSPRSAR